MAECEAAEVGVQVSETQFNIDGWYCDISLTSPSMLVIGFIEEVRLPLAGKMMRLRMMRIMMMVIMMRLMMIMMLMMVMVVVVVVVMTMMVLLLFPPFNFHTDAVNEVFFVQFKPQAF